MRRDKYAPDISLTDLSTYVREHRDATGYDCTCMLHFGDGPGGQDWAEARLVPVGQMSSQTPTVTARGPLKTVRIASTVSVLLHLVAQAYQQVETDLWLWAPSRRAAARGEEGCVPPKA